MDSKSSFDFDNRRRPDTTIASLKNLVWKDGRRQWEMRCEMGSRLAEKLLFAWDMVIEVFLTADEKQIARLDLLRQVIH